MITTEDIEAGELAANWVANMEDMLFKYKCHASMAGKTDLYIFNVGTTALVELLGQHLVNDKASSEYMQKVYDELYNVASGNTAKPVLTIVE